MSGALACLQEGKRGGSTTRPIRLARERLPPIRGRARPPAHWTERDAARRAERARRSAKAHEQLARTALARRIGSVARSSVLPVLARTSRYLAVVLVEFEAATSSSESKNTRIQRALIAALVAAARCRLRLQKYAPTRGTIESRHEFERVFKNTRAAAASAADGRVSEYCRFPRRIIEQST